MIPVIGSGNREPWLGVIRRRSLPLVDWELGASALGDPSSGLASTQWRGEYSDGSVVLTAGAQVHSLPGPAQVDWFAFSFDQNMAPVMVYQVGDTITIAPQNGDPVVFTGQHPCVCLDERRSALIDRSDVNVSYIRGGSLYCRTQRERYGTERLLATGWRALTGFAPTTGQRLQWRGQTT